MSEEPLYLDVEAFQAIDDVSPAAAGLAMRLVTQVWFADRKGFLWQPEVLAGRLVGKGITAESVAALKDEVERFFTILPDGRWVPSPHLFSMTDGNLDNADARRRAH